MAKTFMRVDKELLVELTKNKIASRESYAQVVKRMLAEKNAKKDLLTTEQVKRKLRMAGLK